MQPETKTASVHFKVSLCWYLISPSACLRTPSQAPVSTSPFCSSHDDHQWSLTCPVQGQFSILSSTSYFTLLTLSPAPGFQDTRFSWCSCCLPESSFLASLDGSWIFILTDLHWIFTSTWWNSAGLGSQISSYQYPCYWSQVLPSCWWSQVDFTSKSFPEHHTWICHCQQLSLNTTLSQMCNPLLCETPSP